MSIGLYTLTSSLHKETEEDVSKELFIQHVEDALNEKFLFYGTDYSSYGSHERDLIYIRTGGTESLFKNLNLDGDIRLLTSGDSNSLAASMEILSFLRQRGQKGEILHGKPDEIASRIRSDIHDYDATSSFLHAFKPISMGGVRLGVIGKPSDWLISSNVDYDKARCLFDVELVDIDISELIDEIKKNDVDLRSFDGSLVVYDSLKTLIGRYNLSGLTLRCFDLLDAVHNTGCLALAKLNAEGIPSSCEGDIPALLSMVYLQKVNGCPGFQCNLSRIEGDRLLFAHCTIPLTMVSSYRYMTHFESGIGTAIKGDLPLGDVDIFKISPDLEHCIRIPGRIISNESHANLCRTQIVVESEGASQYFLREPLANHHIITPAARNQQPA